MSDRPEWLPSHKTVQETLEATDARLGWIDEECSEAVMGLIRSAVEKALATQEARHARALEIARMEERERWQVASMLETSAGDPADLTPEMLERFMSGQERDHARALLEAKIEALVTMAGHDHVGWQDREHLPDLCSTCVETVKLRHQLAALRAKETA